MTLRILLVDEDQARLSTLRAAVEQAGWVLAGTRPNSADLSLHARECAAHVIVCACNSPSPAVIEAVRALNRDAPLPVVVFADRSDPALSSAAVQAGVASLVVQGLSPARLRAVVEVALARFKSDQALRAELNQARTALSERKLIDRAKGMLMQARGMTEEEAYQTMRKLAMDQGKRMADIASNVIAIADVLGKAS